MCSLEDIPVMIHRAILGSVERMFAILLEHYGGKWYALFVCFLLRSHVSLAGIFLGLTVSAPSGPYGCRPARWLSCPSGLNTLHMPERFIFFLHLSPLLSPSSCAMLLLRSELSWCLIQVVSEITAAGFYCDLDDGKETLQKRVRQASVLQYNYVLVVSLHRKLLYLLTLSIVSLLSPAY